jgi:hypothetical protein
MIKKLAVWALAGLILADLVPTLILDAKRNIENLSYEAGQAYAAWKCPAGYPYRPTTGRCQADNGWGPMEP